MPIANLVTASHNAAFAFTSLPLNIDGIKTCAFQASFSGASFNGTFDVQLTNDLISWNSIPMTSGSTTYSAGIPAVGPSPSPMFINLVDPGALYTRIVFTPDVSSVGTLSAITFSTHAQR